MVLLCAFAVVAGAQVARPQAFENGYYRLTNKWLGEGKALDVVNDGSTDKLQMADADGSSGQAWKFTRIGDVYYRLTPKWLDAGRSLNAVNDGKDTKVDLERSGNLTGQYWKITPIGDGFYRLTTKWLGEERSLDIVNDSQKRALQLAETDEVTGQYWMISPVAGKTSSTGPVETGIHPLGEFKKITFVGFTLNVNPELMGKAVTNRALDLLRADLTKITKLLTPLQVGRLRKVPVWIQYKFDSSGMWYHESKEWLVKSGYPAAMVKSVEISDVNDYVACHNDQPMELLHEFAHAYQDQYLSAMRDKIEDAYNNALKSHKYEKVERSGGGMERAYAMTNEVEYFAELTEAYFGRNDYYPFTRDELEEFDSKGFALMEDAWGSDN